MVAGPGFDNAYLHTPVHHSDAYELRGLRLTSQAALLVDQQHLRHAKVHGDKCGAVEIVNPCNLSIMLTVVTLATHLHLISRGGWNDVISIYLSHTADLFMQSNRLWAQEGILDDHSIVDEAGHVGP
jgi:hypothetical protein